MYEEGLDSPYVFRAVGAYELAFKAMDELLASGSDWLVDDMFSLAEINLAPLVARLEYLRLLDIWIAENSGVAAWWGRLKKRPSYRSEVAELLTTGEKKEMLLAGMKIRARITEIHTEYLAWA